MEDEGQLIQFLDERLPPAPDPQSLPRCMFAIDKFEAEDEDGSDVTVVGVVTLSDILEFVVIKEAEGGELFPSTASSVFRKAA